MSKLQDLLNYNARKGGCFVDLVRTVESEVSRCPYEPAAEVALATLKGYAHAAQEMVEEMEELVS